MSLVAVLARAAAALVVALGSVGCGSPDRGAALAVPDWPEPPGTAFPATVDRIVDGDTFVARRQGRPLRVRLIGIDAPESVQPDAPVECFGPQSARELKRLLTPGTRLIAAYQGSQQTDQFGRELWDVWVDGRFLQAELVSRGFARARAYRPQTRYADLLLQLGEGAQQAHAGLFAACPA